MDGFFAVDNWPLPKSHVQEVGEPVDLSVKTTLSGEHPVTTSVEKSATGVCPHIMQGTNKHSNRDKVNLK